MDSIAVARMRKREVAGDVHAYEAATRRTLACKQSAWNLTHVSEEQAAIMWSCGLRIKESPHD